MRPPDRLRTRRPDWSAIRETIDLAEVAVRLLGQAPGRRGERKARLLWWTCPLGAHEDANPSFCIEPGKSWWRCYGCGERGDAAGLVMKVQGITFPEAVAYLTGTAARSGKARPRPTPSPAPRARPDAPGSPGGMTEAGVLAIVEAASSRVWSPGGADALAYLTGPRRGLTPESIRAFRLGWTLEAKTRTREGRTYAARGIVIPWLDGGRPALVKVRQPEGRKPKYCEIYRNPDRPPRIYPGPDAIRPGRPLVIVEGEFDALLLGQSLGAMAAVVTLGSASARPVPALLGPMLAAAPWYIATDSDDAGEKAAGGWPSSARRVRPPGTFKDWTEAHGGWVDLRRWWRDILAGREAPPLYIDRPRRLAAIYEAAKDDPYAREERLAIRGENAL